MTASFTNIMNVRDAEFLCIRLADFSKTYLCLSYLL